MKRAEAKEQIKLNWREIMGKLYGQAKQTVNGEESYICPLCGHGNGGDGIAHNPKSKDPGALHCFGCDFSGDVIALYQEDTGKSFAEALDDLSWEIGIDIDKYNPTEAAREAFSEPLEDSPTERKKTAENGNQSPERDFTAYYMECLGRLDDPAALEYLKSRGISYETAAAVGIGYDPAADPAGAPGATGNEYKAHPLPRLIIPTGKGNYATRSIEPATEKKYQKMNCKGGKAGIFNLPVLYSANSMGVIVAEGVFDALSFMEIGYPAIALNSTSNTRLLSEALEARRTENTLIICLDNDPAGMKAAAELAKGLDRLNISYICPAPSDYLPEGCKDANEALATVGDYDFSETVERIIKEAAKPDNVEDYINSSMSADIEAFGQDKKTGFPLLDSQAGGLYPGLYVIGAISSIGKTTYTAQLADQLAEQGHEVIFFSLEQSRLEMVTKSITRTAAKQSRDLDFTSLSIRKGWLPEKVLKAKDEYVKSVGNRLSIVEGNFNCDVSFIGNYVRRYARQTGVKPVVIIDYLQILQPGESARRQTTKEAIDSTVTELKRLSRELDITVIVISSLNRSNYLTPVDFESFKESGGIEYTADCIWGLQLQVINDDVFSKSEKIKEKREMIKKAKAANPRQIELVCLKNRYGIANFSCYFEYYPKADLFVETIGPNAADEEWGHTVKRKRI